MWRGDCLLTTKDTERQSLIEIKTDKYTRRINSMIHELEKKRSRSIEVRSENAKIVSSVYDYALEKYGRRLKITSPVCNNLDGVIKDYDRQIRLLKGLLY